MTIDNEKLEIINHIQEGMKEKKLIFVVFHEDDTYTVTSKIELAMRINKPIFAVSFYNVLFLGVIPQEEKEEVKQYLLKVQALEKEESIYEMTPMQPTLQEEEVNPFLELPFEDNFDEEEVMHLFDEPPAPVRKFTPALEEPTLASDLFLLVGHELGYYTEELNQQLQYLGRMLPIYREYFEWKNEDIPDIKQLAFIYDNVLQAFDKSKEEIDLFISVMDEKLLETDDVIYEQSNPILVELFLSGIMK